MSPQIDQLVGFLCYIGQSYAFEVKHESLSPIRLEKNDILIKNVLI